MRRHRSQRSIGRGEHRARVHEVEVAQAGLARCCRVEHGALESPRTSDTACGDGGRCLVGQAQPGVAQRLRHRGGGERDDRQPMVHRLEQRHAEALVIRQAHEHVRRSVVRGERRVGHRSGKPHDPFETEARDRSRARRARIAATTTLPRGRAWRRGRSSAPVQRERAQHVVLALVRGDPTDEQPLAPLLRCGEPIESAHVDPAVERCDVDEHRCDRGRPVPHADRARLG